MPDDIHGLLALLRSVGAGPLLGGALLLLLFRLATPETLRGAIGRLYEDIAPLLKDYWRARTEARQAEAARDRTIEEHWRGHLAPDAKRPAAHLAGGPIAGAGPGPDGGLEPSAPEVAAGQEGVGYCGRGGCPFRAGPGGEQMGG